MLYREVLCANFPRHVSEVHPACHTLELGEVYESMPLLAIPPGKRI